MSSAQLNRFSPSDLLILPPSVARSRESGSKVLQCTLCEGVFPLDQQEKFGRHVRNCADAHDDQIQAEAERRRTNPLTAIADPELFDHMRRGGT